VQYFSQAQRSSGKSHCAQRVGPCIGPLQKTLPEHGTMRQAEGEEGAPSCLRAPFGCTAKLGCERVGQLLIIKLTGRIKPRYLR
jgi:hypothetical protein